MSSPVCSPAAIIGILLLAWRLLKTVKIPSFLGENKRDGIISSLSIGRQAVHLLADSDSNSARYLKIG